MKSRNIAQVTHRGMEKGYKEFLFSYCQGLIGDSIYRLQDFYRGRIKKVYWEDGEVYMEIQY